MPGVRGPMSTVTQAPAELTAAHPETGQRNTSRKGSQLPPGADLGQRLLLAQLSQRPQEGAQEMAPLPARLPDCYRTILSEQMQDHRKWPALRLAPGCASQTPSFGGSRCGRCPVYPG